MSHTPGPWKLHEHYYGEPLAVDAEDGRAWVVWSRRIASCDGGRLIAEVSASTSRVGWPQADNRQEMEANARLIAAAPELLMALQALVDGGWHAPDCNSQVFGDKCDCGMEAKFDAARDAIAKATGRGDEQ